MTNWERVQIESDLDWSEVDDYSIMDAIINECSLKFYKNSQKKKKYGIGKVCNRYNSYNILYWFVY